MKRKHWILFVLLWTLLICTPGCQDTGGKEYAQALGQKPEPVSQPIAQIPDSPVLDGEITIFERHQGEYTIYAQKAREFMKEHTGVQIHVEQSGLDASAHQLQLSTRLMSGDAPDILSFPDRGGKSAASGLLLELDALMDGDPDFHKEDYYTNLLDASRVGEKLYVVPLSPSIELYFFNRRITDPLGWDFEKNPQLDYRQLFEIYNTAIDQEILDPEKVGMLYGSKPSKSFPIWWEQAAYLDWESKVASFDSPDFVELLKISNTLRTKGTEQTGQILLGAEPSMADNMNNSLMVAQPLYPDMTSILDYESETMSGPVRMISSEGAKRFDGQITAVSSACKNPELAWVFLKYCMDGGEESPRGTIFPLNRKVLQERYSGKAKSRYWSNIDGFLSTSNQLGVTPPFLLEDTTKAILSQYYDSALITAEDCARQLQERAEIMMRE